MQTYVAGEYEFGVTALGSTSNIIIVDVNFWTEFDAKQT